MRRERRLVATAARQTDDRRRAPRTQQPTTFNARSHAAFPYPPSENGSHYEHSCRCFLARRDGKPAAYEHWWAARRPSSDSGVDCGPRRTRCHGTFGKHITESCSERSTNGLPTSPSASRQRPSYRFSSANAPGSAAPNKSGRHSGVCRRASRLGDAYLVVSGHEDQASDQIIAGHGDYLIVVPATPPEAESA